MANDILTIAGANGGTFTSPLVDGSVFRTTFNPNLLQVQITDEVGYEDSTNADNTQTIALLCNGVQIKNPTLKFSDVHVSYRDSFVTGVDVPNEVTFTWYEGNYLPVWTFHQGWLARYYDRVRDTFISGKVGKLKHAEIIVYDYLWDQMIPKFRFSFWGLKPTSIPDLELGWNKDGADYSITYKYRMVQFDATPDQGQTWVLQGYM